MRITKPYPDTIKRWKDYTLWTTRGLLIFTPVILAACLFGDRFQLWHILLN